MLSNAMILSVAPPGTPGPGGDVTTPGADAWRGRVPAMLTRRRTRMVSGGQQVSVFRDMLAVQRPPQPLLSVVPGDDTAGWTVLVEDRRAVVPVTRRFRLALVDHRAAGLSVDSLRLELDDEQAA